MKGLLGWIYARAGPCPPRPPCLLHVPVCCCPSCWLGRKRRGQGLAWERVQEDFITQCLLVAVGAVLSPPPAGRHAWPARVITSQHFILLVSFHFLGMWAPKYFIPACSCLFLPGQTAGQAAGPSPWLLSAHPSICSCCGGGASQRSSSHPCPTQGTPLPTTPATSPSLTPPVKESGVERPGGGCCWK